MGNLGDIDNQNQGEAWEKFHLWAVNDSIETISKPFGRVKMQAFCLNVICLINTVRFIDLTQPLWQLSTWFPEGSIGWYLLTALTILTWRVALTGECVMMARLPSAPKYILIANAYILIYTLLLGIISGKTVYGYLLGRGLALAVTAGIFAGLACFMILRVRKQLKVCKWFGSAAGLHLFPLDKRENLTQRQSCHISLYVLAIIVAAVYFIKNSFQV